MKQYSSLIACLLLLACFLFLPQTAHAQVIFSDTFQDADGTGINAHQPMWECNNNDNQIQGNVLKVTALTTCFIPAVTNGSIEFNATDLYNFYIALRDSQSILHFNPTSGQIEEQRSSIDGAWHPLASWNPSGTHTYKVAFSQASLSVYVDGSQVYTGSDLTNLLSGTANVEFFPNDGYASAMAKINSFTEETFDAIPTTLASLSPAPNAQLQYADPTTVTLHATTSGGFSIANTYYTIDNGTQQTYSGPFAVTKSGNHTLKFWSVDNASVTEAQKTHVFTIVAPVPVNPHVILSDTFQDANGTHINTHQPLWGCDPNDDVIENNALNIVAGAICFIPPVTDGSIEFTATDLYNFYITMRDSQAILHFNPTSGQIEEQRSSIDNAWHPLAPRTPSGTHTYKVVFNKAILSVYVDGNLVHSGGDLTGLLGGTANIRFFSNDGLSSSTAILHSFTLTDYNTAPSVGTITASSNPGHINTPISASASFTDVDTSDTHTATWDWGDGNTTTGTVSESNGSGSVSDSHLYANFGTYTIKLTVKDTDNATGYNTLSFTVVKQITALSPATVWISKNLLNIGLKLDLKAEVYKDTTLVSSGQLNSVTVGTGGNPTSHVINFNLFSPVDFPSGSQLKVQVYARNACSGSLFNSGAANLYFNSSAQDSRFGATIGTTATTYHLLDGFLLGTAAGTSQKSISVAAGAKCSPFKSFGTWAITP